MNVNQVKSCQQFVARLLLLTCKHWPWLFARLPDGYTFYSVSQERIMDEMDEEAKRARMQGPKTGANWGAFPDHCWTVCWRSTWQGRHLYGIMLIYIPTEVDVSDVETSLDFFFSAFNEMQVLLLTKTRLGLDICLSVEKRNPLACKWFYVLPGSNSVWEGYPKSQSTLMSANVKSAVAFNNREC